MHLGQSFKGNPTFVYLYAILCKLEDKKRHIGPHKYAFFSEHTQVTPGLPMNYLIFYF